MAEPPPIGMSATDWTLEQTRALLRLAEDPESFKQVNILTQVIAGLMNGTLWDNRAAARDELLAKIQETMKKAGDTAGGALGAVISTVYGVDAVGGSLGTIASGGGTAAARKAAGDAIVATIFEIFNLAGVADGYRNRAAGTEEQHNFARFVGMNWQLQMADLIAEMAAQWVPWDVMGGVREIGDKIQKVLGLEDAQEEIMEPLMEKLIIAGLEQRFNRVTKPTDLAPGDAVQAFIQGLIPEAQYNKTLDNAGIMDDVRAALLKLRAKNLTEADFRDLYQRGTWTESDVLAAFRAIGYLEDDAQLKTNLILQDREFTLRKELLNVKESQFVAGVLDEGSLRTYLATLSFSAEEEDLEIEIAKGKASLARTAKPKQITGTFNVAPWRVRPGNTAMMSWNIRNADTITISGIGAVAARGERVITPEVSQTYILTAESDTDSERFEAAVQVGETRELKRPTASFSASPGRIQIGTPVQLSWSTSGAETVSIDGIGGVAEAGAVPVFPFLSTIYTLRATNAQGTTVRQDIVFVEPPDVDFDRERRPSISFSISPPVVDKKQPRSEVKWSISRAEGGTITFPNGDTQNVGRNGAFIITTTESGIYTLRASNLFGETQNQEAIIVKQALEEEPPPPPEEQVPVLTLSVSPGTATPGESLSVFWNIVGATIGTLIFPDATSRQVGVSGSQAYLAPSVAGTYEFRLQASNPAGPASQSVVIVVSTVG